MNATTKSSSVPLLPPVVKTLVVARAQADAFRLYTAEIAKWWPAATHSLGQAKVAEVVLEPRAGGRLFERWHDGTENLWGTILVWEPPHRLVHSWHVATDREHASEVELRFGALGSQRTRVTLEHRHWERMSGERAPAVRESYEGGWEIVLRQRYGAHAGIAEDEK
jgi:uncharacterized protein YndB with AHSA1/START domain